MILALLMFFAVILCVMGITELICFLKIFMLSPHCGENKYLTVFLKKEDYSLQLACAVETYRWHGNSMFNGIIALTDELSSEDISFCAKTYASKLGKIIHFCNVSDIELLLNNVKKQDE